MVEGWMKDSPYKPRIEWGPPDADGLYIPTVYKEMRVPSTHLKATAHIVLRAVRSRYSGEVQKVVVDRVLQSAPKRTRQDERVVQFTVALSPKTFDTLPIVVNATMPEPETEAQLEITVDPDTGAVSAVENQVPK